MDPALSTLTPDICRLESPAFRGFPNLLFRRAADDGAPVLVVRMGERDGVVPLRGLQIRLGIPDDSLDGRMLARIGAALDFVNELRPGDTLPAEVRNGAASWRPEAGHRHIASRRLRERLVEWLQAIGAPDHGQLRLGDFDQAGRDPALAARLNAAFTLIAVRLGVPGAREAIVLMEELVTELAWIEALRERLLVPLRHTARKLDIVSAQRRGEGLNTEMLNQVRRLCAAALSAIGTRFTEVDMMTENIIGALSGGVAQQTRIRSNRDWLYRSYRAAEPILKEWNAAAAEIDANFWNRLARTYRFLAPRFMATQEWKAPPGPDQNPAPGRAR